MSITVVVQQCCGCSCDVCAVVHQSGNHTKECWERLMKEAEAVND